MPDVNRLARNWQQLINVADHQMKYNPIVGFYIRDHFNKIVAEYGQSDKLTATAILETMEIVTRELATCKDTSYYAGQLVILSVLMASLFPATTGLAAKGYECGVKSFHSEDVICPN